MNRPINFSGYQQKLEKLEWAIDETGHLCKVDKMKINTIIFARINEKWQATWIDGDCIGHRDLKWYEWPYFYMLRIRNFIKKG